MRSVLALLLVLLAGCPSDVDGQELSSGDGGDELDPVTDGPPGEPRPEAACAVDEDCAAAAATCCECPTFAVNADDPLVQACRDVACDSAPTCSATAAVCGASGTCELVCNPVVCGEAFPDGFATDSAGCLVCAAAASSGECTSDAGCVETRADCCGCEGGGANTAVSASTVSAYDDALGCEPGVVCPGIDVCDPNAAPTCTQGRCELLSSVLPPGACGDADLPPCPAGQACVLNVDPAATVRGLGVCVPE